MPKETNDMATLESSSKYDAKSAPVTKNGGNKAIHVGVESAGEKYPTPKGGSYNVGKGMNG